MDDSSGNYLQGEGSTVGLLLTIAYDNIVKKGLRARRRLVGSAITLLPKFAGNVHRNRYATLEILLLVTLDKKSNGCKPELKSQRRAVQLLLQQ